MKTLISILALISFYSHSSIIEGSREHPTIIECDTCITSSDYENKVSRALRPHETKYFAIINNQTRQVRTYWGYDISEREIGIFFKEIYQVSNLPEHEEQFQDHLVWIASARPPKSVVLEYPSQSAGGSCCFYEDSGPNYASFARQQLIKRDFLYAGKIYIVTIKFDNNYKIVMEIPPYSSGYVIVAIIAPDGSLVQSGSSGSGDGGGSGGSSSASSITFSNAYVGGGTLMCSFSGTTLNCRWV